MKKFIAIALLTVAIIVAMCGCGNHGIDTAHEFDYALIRLPDGSNDTIEIKQWTNYGDYLKIVADDGTVYRVATINCVLVKEA